MFAIPLIDTPRDGKISEHIDIAHYVLRKSRRIELSSRFKSI